MSEDTHSGAPRRITREQRIVLFPIDQAPQEWRGKLCSGAALRAAALQPGLVYNSLGHFFPAKARHKESTVGDSPHLRRTKIASNSSRPAALNRTRRREVRKSCTGVQSRATFHSRAGKTVTCRKISTCNKVLPCKCSVPNGISAQL